MPESESGCRPWPTGFTSDSRQRGPEHISAQASANRALTLIDVCHRNEYVDGVYYRSGQSNIQGCFCCKYRIVLSNKKVIIELGSHNVGVQISPYQLQLRQGNMELIEPFFHKHNKLAHWLRLDGEASLPPPLSGEYLPKDEIMFNTRRKCHISACSHQVRLPESGLFKSEPRHRNLTSMFRFSLENLLFGTVIREFLEAKVCTSHP